MTDRHPAYSIRNGVMTPIAAADFDQSRRGHPPAQKRAAAPAKPKGTPGEQIKAAVAAARRKDPTIPEGYAANAITAGKTVDQVKAELFNRVFGVDKARSKANMVAELKRAGMTAKSDEPTGRGASMRKTMRDIGLDPKPAA